MIACLLFFCSAYSFRHLSGKEIFAASALMAVEEVLFIVNHLAGLNTTHVIRCKGTLYDIISRVDDCEGYRYELNCMRKGVDFLTFTSPARMIKIGQECLKGTDNTMTTRYKKWLFVFSCSALLALFPMVAYADFPEMYYNRYCDRIGDYTTYRIMDFWWCDDTVHWPAYKCTSCGRSANFDYKEVHYATTEATCTSRKICAVCDYVMEKALGHDTACAISGSTPITCTSAGYCARCSSSYGAPLGHDYTVTGTSYTGKAATCTGKAVCGRCGEEYGDMLGHNKVSHTAKAPSCTAIGWGAYVSCTRCDITTYVEKAALGHDEVSHTAKAPSCTTIGWEAYDT